VDAGGPAAPGSPELVARARELLERAAWRAERLGSPVEAHRHYVSALACSDEPTERARLEEGVARAALAAGLNDEAGERAVKAVATYDAMGRPYDAARVAAIKAQALIEQQKLREAVALLEPRWRALEGDPGAGAAVLPMAEALARAHNYLSEFRPALAYAERALRLADANRDYPRLVAALSRYAVIWAFDGVPTAARALLDLAASLARDHQLRHALLRPLVNIAALDLSRNLSNALRTAREALDVAQQVGYPTEAHFATLNLMIGLRLAGRWAELRELLLSLDDTSPDTPPDIVLIAIVQSWWLATATGEETPDVPEFDPNDYDEFVVAAWAQHVALIRARDNADCALVARLAPDLVDRAVQASGLDDDFPHHWPLAVEAALECGLDDLAGRLLRHVSDAPPGLVTPYLHAQLLRLRGLLGFARAESASGEADLRAAIAALGEFGAVPDRARTEIALAEQLLHDGRVADAQPLLASARATFADLGATAWLAAANELAARAAVASAAHEPP
jgi:tetratricopeptide (TPR) repeat protein